MVFSLEFQIAMSYNGHGYKTEIRFAIPMNRIQRLNMSKVTDTVKYNSP
jgi:hypothetical protein